jgi:spore germination protein
MKKGAKRMEIISQRQLILIGTSFVLNATLLGPLVQVIQKGGTDAWMSVPIAGLPALVSVWMLAATARRFPDRDLFQALAERRPVAGRIVGLAFIAYFFFLLCRDFRMLVLFINITLLEFTPLFVVAVLILVCTVYMARGGVEVTARVTEMWTFLFAASVLFIPLLMAGDLRIHHLFPMLYDGFMPVLHGSWYLFPFVGEIVVLPFIAGFPTFGFKSGTRGLLLGIVCIFVLLACSLLVLGANVASRFNFPAYEVVRLIQLTDFLDRLELPLVAIWMPTMIAKMAFGLILAGRGLSRMFPALSERELIMPFGSLAVVFSFVLFRDLTEMLVVNRLLPFIGLVFQIGLPLVMLLALRPGRQA